MSRDGKGKFGREKCTFDGTLSGGCNQSCKEVSADHWTER